MKLNSSSLQLVMLPGVCTSANTLYMYNEAYRLWKQVWRATYAELDGTSQIYSDEFTRQSEVGAVFQENRCVAVCCMRFVNFELDSTVDDTYFKTWPESAVQRLTKDGDRVLIASHVTVDPDYRGTLEDGIHLKKITLALMIKRMLESESTAMSGAMRCNRNMDNAAYETGATNLETRITMHGVDVELVAWYANYVRTNVRYEMQIDRLWTNRIVSEELNETLVPVKLTVPGRAA